MSNSNISEVDVFRYFELSPIGKAELLFSLVKAKMAERLAKRPEAEPSGPGMAKRRRGRKPSPTLTIGENAGSGQPGGPLRRQPDGRDA